VPLTASTLVLHGRYRLFALLLGGTAGPAALGHIHMAFRLVDAVRELVSTAMWRLILPSMSERQGDLPALLRQIDRALGLIGFTLFPLCSVMLVGIAPLTQLLLGPPWAPSGTAALPLVGLAAWLFLLFPSGVACVARGAPRCALRANLASTVALALGVVLVRPAPPLAAAWSGWRRSAWSRPTCCEHGAGTWHTLPPPAVRRTACPGRDRPRRRRRDPAA
jgi:O-antigen/teichoic acid export membrane protein